MEKLLAIFGAVGLTATGAISIIACHKEEATTTRLTEEAQNAINSYSYITFTFVSNLFTKDGAGTYLLVQNGQGTLSLMPDNIIGMNLSKINGVDIPMSILSAMGMGNLVSFINSLNLLDNGIENIWKQRHIYKRGFPWWLLFIKLRKHDIESMIILILII
ncbi:hypothetical protein P344_00820 [Spiroplasma mirum ATCC 29335]|uniref:Uncharacterized protein n=1 Tax=Spiroplasma mirum ATCC 29335 TaxID=838561 RepID=W0GKD1_9MOLU|nr:MULTISPECIES: lipoprotein [Spiroplasma]AHF60602.1 hypothetical protein SMM_0138 [Spiroplasma mirum ATCC 29335]AHI57537.1 hypothetical protein P344_00820 [Spiroplasma mirum ATCC 29335]AKM52720.1 hypothetical protein SATRI_v1c01450 [Spiroplasma atrichopogonis]